MRACVRARVAYAERICRVDWVDAGERVCVPWVGEHGVGTRGERAGAEGRERERSKEGGGEEEFSTEAQSPQGIFVRLFQLVECGEGELFRTDRRPVCLTQALDHLLDTRNVIV